jgi:CelD/BcsL family acetyltransferase involved in cellulose biosynthesis
MLRFERICLEPGEWKAVLENYPDRTVFQTPEWLKFLVNTQGGEPVLARLQEGSSTLGYFSGMVVQKFGFRILGSPFAGWTTAYMGMNLSTGVSRRAAVEALRTFAWNELRCVHLEFMDRRLSLADLEDDKSFAYRFYDGFEIDLTQTEDELFGKMDSACRRCIRKAAKSGVVIEEARDLEFADDYYAQLQDVFAKQKLVPPYGVERVRELIRCLLPTGNLLLLRARDPDGRSIATAVLPGMNDTFYMWGAASWREHQILRPNELLLWEAMKRWKARGIGRFDMSGSGDYKRKYGGQEISVPWFRVSRYALVVHLRETAKKTLVLKQRLLGRIEGYGAA